MEIQNIYIPTEILIYIFNNLNDSQQILLSNINHDFRNFIKYYMIKNNIIKFQLIMQSDNISLLKWCIYNGCDINKICSNLASNGHLKCLKYAHENGCPLSDSTCSNASNNGHLGCFIYSYQNGCQFNMMDAYTCMLMFFLNNFNKYI